MSTTNEIVRADVGGDALMKQTEWLAKRDAVLVLAGQVTAVESEGDLERAGKIYTDVATLVKELEKKRLDITRPLDDVKKQIMSAEKDMTAKLTSEQDRIKRMNNAYATKKMQEAQAEQRRVDELNRIEQANAAELQRKAQEEADAKAATAQSIFGAQAVTTAQVQAQAPVVPQVQYCTTVEAPRASANTIRTEWKFEVLDSEKVPRELCTVDEKKIRAHLTYQKSMGANIENLQIAGLRLWQEANVCAR
jgi:TolA-binding protein